MSKFASDTSVSVGKSKEEIERTLTRYGATGFMSGWDSERSTAMLTFRIANRMVRFILPIPNKSEFQLTPQGRRRRTALQIEQAWEQAQRQRYRALNLVIKAKLEAVEAGISSLEQEFLSNILLPNNQTVGEYAIPEIAAAYETGKMPKLLPGGK
jgi:hypothetical protein